VGGRAAGRDEVLKNERERAERFLVLLADNLFFFFALLSPKKHKLPP
jgi:hypothetical protein